MINSAQCVDLQADRAVGEYWERQFCKMAAHHGKMFTPHQIGREKSAQACSIFAGKYKLWTLPDVTVWTRPGEHHELKHKDPAKTLGGSFGLERYRLDSLIQFAAETGQRVFYTIHNYALQPNETRAGKKLNRENNHTHWVTSDVTYLNQNVDANQPGASWVAGRRQEVQICYWRVERFFPLMAVWRKLEMESA